MLADAHIHLVNLLDRDPGFPERRPASWTCCAASHDDEEWQRSEALRERLPSFIASFGIHPQWAVWKNAGLLERLCGEGKIKAIGEAGFDFFGDHPERIRTAENEKTQREIFEFQLELGRKFGLPLLLHLRKAMDLSFEYASGLKALPAAIFHSYSGSARDAESLLKRGINAFFSFGAPILNGNKRAMEACALVPGNRILAETDAPWQPPRSDIFDPQRFCKAEDLQLVVNGIAKLRGLPEEKVEEITEKNFKKAFSLAL